MRARSAGPKKRSSVTTPGAAARNRARSRRAYSVWAEPTSSGVTCAVRARDGQYARRALRRLMPRHARAPPQARRALPAAARARRWRPGTRRPPQSAAAPSPATGARSSSAACARAPARGRRRAAPREAAAARPAAAGSGRGPSAAPAAGPAAHPHCCRDGNDVTAVTRSYTASRAVAVTCGRSAGPPARDKCCETYSASARLSTVTSAAAAAAPASMSCRKLRSPSSAVRRYTR